MTTEVDFVVHCIQTGTAAWKPEDDNPYSHIYQVSETNTDDWNLVAINTYPRIKASEVLLHDTLDVLLEEFLRQSRLVSRLYVYQIDWDTQVRAALKENLRHWPSYMFNNWTPRYKII